MKRRVRFEALLAVAGLTAGILAGTGGPALADPKPQAPGAPSVAAVLEKNNLFAKEHLERLKIACSKGYEEFDRSLARFEQQFHLLGFRATDIENFEKEEAKSSSHSAFLDLARFLWPETLPDSDASRLGFVSCNVDRGELHGFALKDGTASDAEDALTSWKACLENMYPAESKKMPPVAAQLLDCYKELVIRKKNAAPASKSE